MEFGREKSKLSIKRQGSTDLFKDEPLSHKMNSDSTTTPIRINNRSEDEESPYFPCSTQEMREDVDVLWDYDSPQSKPKTAITRKSKKKLNLQQSPKVPFRRHPSNNTEQIKQEFCKLREELKALKAEIAKPDREESLILSPREEAAFKKTQDTAEDPHLIDFEHIIDEPPIFESDNEDPFDDGMDDQLIMFSQQIEHDIGANEKDNDITVRLDHKKGQPVSNYNVPSIPKVTSSSSNNIRYDCEKPPNGLNNCCPVICDNQANFLNQKSTSVDNSKKKGHAANLQDSEVFNDSFDNALAEMDEDEFDQLTQVVDIKQYKNGNNVLNDDKRCKVFPRSRSENKVSIESVQTVTGKVEWHRTQSFESYSNTQLSKEKMLEIERKRLEAKAKLEAKKKHDTVITTIPEISDSPLKCSPDEIEKKRLQALAKLQAKRQQELIEKKKREALKRLEENRKKNASQVKSALSNRL